jgi:hypothetical protein
MPHQRAAELIRCLVLGRHGADATRAAATLVKACVVVDPMMTSKEKVVVNELQQRSMISSIEIASIYLRIVGPSILIAAVCTPEVSRGVQVEAMEFLLLAVNAAATGTKQDALISPIVQVIVVILSTPSSTRDLKEVAAQIALKIAKITPRVFKHSVAMLPERPRGILENALRDVIDANQIARLADANQQQQQQKKKKKKKKRKKLTL